MLAPPVPAVQIARQVSGPLQLIQPFASKARMRPSPEPT